MGTIFLELPVPQKLGLLKYRISLKVIATSYFIMAALSMAILIFKIPDNGRELLAFTGICISSFQAFLFTFAIVTLLNPKFVSLKKLLIHLSPIIVSNILFIIFRFIFGNPAIIHFNEIPLYIKNPTLWVRIIFYLFYVFQLIYYTLLFLKEEKLYKNQLMNYFSDEIWLKLSWVRLGFFSALCIGVVVMVSYFFPQKYDWVFTLLYSAFYFGFALEYIKYNKIYTIVEPAVEPEKTEILVSPYKYRIKQDWLPLKKQIVEKQYFLEPGLNIEDLARQLGIGRTVLSTLINREEGVNFNSWINTLRINKAKEYMLTYPNESLSVIAEMVGYTEHANFSHQFKLQTGESPLLWKKNNY
jgi:AraC-like DNA-binding protein